MQHLTTKQRELAEDTLCLSYTPDYIDRAYREACQAELAGDASAAYCISIVSSSLKNTTTPEG